MIETWINVSKWLELYQLGGANSNFHVLMIVSLKSKEMYNFPPNGQKPSMHIPQTRTGA